MNTAWWNRIRRFKQVAELLPQAVAEMKNAEAKLHAVSPDGALPPEQKALQFLQQRKRSTRPRCSPAQQGGGAAGRRQWPRILPDFFEMELDKGEPVRDPQQASQQQSIRSRERWRS